MLERSGVPVPEGRKDLEGRDDILQLHEISTLLIQEGNLDSLYNRIVDAAIGLMSSDMASMQLLDPQHDQLRLLAWKGFHPQSAAFWESVHFNSASTCGIALATGSRVVVPDVDVCDFMAGTADLDEYRRSNIRAVQSTPLVSRSGQLLGMVSTHWRKPHQPQNGRCGDWMFLPDKLPILLNVVKSKPHCAKVTINFGGLLPLSNPVTIRS